MRQQLKQLKRRLRERRNLRQGMRSHDPFVVMRELVRAEQPLIFDVGAHLGLTAARFMRLFPGARIHCFEPFPDSFERLELATRDMPSIELHRLALAAEIGEAEFSVNRNSATNSLLASDPGGRIYLQGDTPETESKLIVPITTLDRFCSERAIESIDILKLDVQGGEYDALLGSAGLLGRAAVSLVYLELITAPSYIGQHRLREYLEVFDEHGYELFDVYHLARGQGRLLQLDAIFLSPDAVAAYERRL